MGSIVREFNGFVLIWFSMHYYAYMIRLKRNINTVKYLQLDRNCKNHYFIEISETLYVYIYPNNVQRILNIA